MSNEKKPKMCVMDEEVEISEFITLDQSEVIRDLAKQIKQNNKDISDIEAIKQAEKELQGKICSKCGVAIKTEPVEMIINGEKHYFHDACSINPEVNFNMVKEDE
ncbi:hypothetical protein [Romboutsia sp. MSSM.1001216sp_RTP31141st1_G3_RTP31141_220114]|uniref:hypothetical protein n=1 Tax=unclassified Romboutsia TaxID=2626894 RepID=UPI0031B5D1A7